MPSSWSAQECPPEDVPPPAAMVVASSMPATGTGTPESPFVPLPSCPFSFFPQQAISPVCCRAQVWLLPEAKAIALVSEGVAGESPLQLAASSARGIRRQSAREIRGGGAVV